MLYTVLYIFILYDYNLYVIVYVVKYAYLGVQHCTGGTGFDTVVTQGTLHYCHGYQEMTPHDL